MVEMSGYNLTPTIDISAKPISQVPPIVLQASTHKYFPSLNESIGIGAQPIVT
jgi:hypothetical protein